VAYKLTSRTNIAANKKGEFSPSQQRVLQEEGRSYLKLILATVFFAILLLGVIFFFVFGGDFRLLHETAFLRLMALLAIVLAIPAVFLSLKGFFYTHRIAKDFAETNIVAVPGEVTWKRGLFRSDYIARTEEGRPLKVLLDEPLSLSPGTYTFYFLGRGKWLLSAEKISAELSDFLPALKDVFHFTQEDLAANREKRMTQRQARQLQFRMVKAMAREGWFVTITYGALGAMGLGLAAIIFHLHFWVWVLLSLIFVAEMWWIKLRRYMNSTSPWQKDWTEKRVRCGKNLEREVKKVTHTHWDRQREKVVKTTRTFYRLKLPAARKVYPSNRRQFNALMKIRNVAYTAYYAPHSRELLSVEAVPVSRKSDAETPPSPTR